MRGGYYNLFYLFAVIAVFCRRRQCLNALEIHTHGKKLQHLLSFCQSTGSYFPTPWIIQGFFVTFLASLIKKLKFARTTRPSLISFQAEDGGTLGIYHLSESGDIQKPVILILHGLTGYGADTNCMWMSNVFKQKGYSVIGMNTRAMGPDVSMTSQRLTDACSSEDVREGIEFIRRKYGTRDIILVGISLGTFLGIRYMAENPNQVMGMFAVSCPVSHYDGLPYLESQCFGSWLDYYLASSIKDIFEKHSEENPEILSIFSQEQIDAIRKSTKIYEMEEHMLSPLNGYEDHLDYWTQAELTQFLPLVKDPLLIINADDDNFINPSAKKKILKFKNENIALCQAKFGGHVGFMSGWFGDTNWVPRLGTEFAEGLVDFHSDAGTSI